MDILAICGSPRRNKTTHSVLQAVLDGCSAQHEIIWPAFMEIGHCISCQKCKYVTPGRCWRDDDMTEALEKMLAARAFIIATPTYFGNVPGPLKNFIDRSVPTCFTGSGDEYQEAEGHGTRPLTGRPAVSLCISGGADHEKTAANVRLVLDYYGYNTIHEFYEGMGGVVITKEDFSEIYEELFAVGKKLDEVLSS